MDGQDRMGAFRSGNALAHIFAGLLVSLGVLLYVFTVADEGLSRSYGSDEGTVCAVWKHSNEVCVNINGHYETFQVPREDALRLRQHDAVTVRYFEGRFTGMPLVKVRVILKP